VTAQQHDLALIEVDEILGRFGHDLASFGLPLPTSTPVSKQASKELRRETDFDRDHETARSEAQRALMRDNVEQARAYDSIVTRVPLSGSGGPSATSASRVQAHMIAVFPFSVCDVSVARRVRPLRVARSPTVCASEIS